MIVRLATRMMTQTDPRLLWKFSYNFGWKGMRAVGKFQKRLKQGECFPAFLFISVTNRCNLKCQGCWSTQTDPPREIALETLDRVISECKARGSYFFGILGGEPLLHKGIFDLFAKHPDCYFLLFSNGTVLTDESAKEMRRLGNVSPLISIEGRKKVSDERRGGVNVYDRAMEGIEHCRRNRLITGVATSVCQTNVEDLACEEFVHELVDMGVHYLWYYIYRISGPNPAPELALEPEQALELRRFIVDIRSRAPIAIVDAYWDHEGKALCPAAVGISHHIGPGGDIEPCPPIQFARENIGDGTDLYNTIAHSKFLEDFRQIVRETTQGCIILERPDLLLDFMRRHGAYDSSGRGTVFDELAACPARSSHNMPGNEIPEKNWMYRFAKKNWFFGFGAYG